ncbi:hexamerin-like [Plodia interpunctella]|uniref:hexamerin-like n=1 Tax=Plodia interpunctella TaxID=58824 RepID=UPI002368DDE3|nr:hexamerin-like [Plodia interpunctella]
MKELTLSLLVVSVVGISGYLIKVPTSPSRSTAIGSRGWVHIQKLMLPLFDNVCEESTNPVIIRLAQEFILNSADFTNPDVVAQLKAQSNKGLIPKGEIFSEFDNGHWAEMQAIYKVLLYAKDFDTFYNVAAWARQNVNCGLFVNAIYLAILNRRDTSKLSIPAPYELLPNYFIGKDVIIKASNILAGQDVTQIEDVKDEGNAYVIDANYTANVNDNEEDSKLAYFREDIGLNSYYFLRKLRLGSWLNAPLDLSNKYGESMYQMMKQFAARYDLERYANNLPILDSIDWDSEVKTYDPLLIYSNGNEFAHRIFDIDIIGNNEIELIKGIENNIDAVISHMRQSGYQKEQILNNLIEILVTSNKSYETMARQLLGNGMEASRQLSVLDHLMTTLRDPVFWRLNKKIVEIIDNALSLLPAYSRNELYFPGVEINNIETKKIMTQFDNFQFDITDALKSNDKDINFQLKINQPRLNHKSFIIKLNVSSLVTQKGLVKLYLGPKMAPGELVSNKNLFVLLDMFEINLKLGNNVISRSSEEMKAFSDDFVSLQDLRKKIEDAEFGLDSLPLNTVDSQIGYPSRLILPKGTPEGLPILIFAFIAPFTKAKTINVLTNSEFNSAILSPGYPLDLAIEDHQLFNLPNCMIKDVVITGKGSGNIFAGYKNKKYGGSETYDPSSRPIYGGKRGGYNQGYEETESEYHEDILPSGLLSLRPDFTKRKESGNYGTKQINYGDKSDSETTNFRDNGKIKRPEFTYSKSKPYDYSSKKGKYDRKDYSYNRTDGINSIQDQTPINNVDLEKDVISSDNFSEKYSSISEEVTEYGYLVHKEDRELVKKQPLPQQAFTIYDLIPPKNDSISSPKDESDERVYE